MGLTVKGLEKFATSKVGTNLYKWASSEKGQKWLYESLPTLETVVATSCYVYATEKQALKEREECTSVAECFASFGRDGSRNLLEQKGF